MNKICFAVVILITALIIGTVSGFEFQTKNETSENITDYGNGVYYIKCTNPEIHEKKIGNINQEKENFGEILSKLIEKNPNMETDIIIPYQEVGYTKGYYVVLQKI